jgi:osmoprotectant transport system permease protein
MNERIAQAFGLLPNYLAQHVLLSAAALALGVALSLPLAVLASRYARIRWPILAAASLVQTIPGLALLALFYPLLLGLSALTKALVGVGVPALGFLPSVSALTLYSMLPILRNGVAGLTGLPPAILEAADGVGMTPRQRLFRVEAPLAAPMVMAGVRTAAVWTIGAATLSTAVGQTSLGNFIFSGLQTENWIFVLFGCAAAAALALAADQLLGLVEAGAARRDLRRFGSGIAGLALGTAAALLPLFAGAGKTYVIGAKNFSEQFILSELISERLEREGVSARHKDGLGSAVAFRALASGDIDCYVDYSGTLWTNVLERRDSPPRERMLAELSRDLKERYGVILLGALGFENAYALAMRADRAAALNLRTIADLAHEAPQLRLGSDLEFLSRPEWVALRDAYGLRFRVERSFNPTFMYRALEDGAVDVISAFSSDGRIAAQKLVVLTDPKHAIPAYDAVILLSPRRADDPMLQQALEPLIGAIPVERMREANFMVDRDADKASPRDAARFLAKALRLPGS